MEHKSSVDKFYDQDDLSAWAKTTGAKATILFYRPADKTRTQLSALRMELATRLGLGSRPSLHHFGLLISHIRV
jgi:aspartyl-tRNA synthetase